MNMHLHPTLNALEGEAAENVQAQGMPTQRLTESDVHFPLTVPRKRNPSIPLLTHASSEYGQSSGISKIKSRGSDVVNTSLCISQPDDHAIVAVAANVGGLCGKMNGLSLQNLPEEILKRIVDYIMGDMLPVNVASSATGLSHRMRHPRRKDVAEISLVSRTFKDIVQERIYRHIKIKGTETGLTDSRDWFEDHPELARHVRHIEYWVPVWGDKSAMASPVQQHGMQVIANDFDFNGPLMNPEHFPGTQFKLSTYSATLSQIFEHLGRTFPNTSIFTLEGGHCKNSNMIKHFQPNLFTNYMKKQQLRILPQVRVFAMKGAWNIMRRFEHWDNIQQALPNMTEWHCGYARPRTEAYNTMNEVLLQLPQTLRHVEISLDSMFSKDDTLLSSLPSGRAFHICEQLGRIAPRLESLIYTGKVCDCFWYAAIEAADKDRSLANRLRNVEIVVKSCCRQRVKNIDPQTGSVSEEEVGSIMADGAGISNLVFIQAFERLVLGAVHSMPLLRNLSRIKLRYIDLDSPCQQLNPYWHLDKSSITGVWSDRILEILEDVQSSAQYEKLEDGIGGDTCVDATARKEPDDVFEWNRSNNLAGGVGAQSSSGVNALFPRTIPKSINTHSYKVLAEARPS